MIDRSPLRSWNDPAGGKITSRVNKVQRQHRPHFAQLDAETSAPHETPVALFPLSNKRTGSEHWGYPRTNFHQDFFSALQAEREQQRIKKRQSTRLTVSITFATIPRR